MFYFNLYVFWREGDAGKLLRVLMAIVDVLLLIYIARIWDKKTYAFANVSLRASFVDLESLRNS